MHVEDPSRCRLIVSRYVMIFEMFGKSHEGASYGVVMGKNSASRERQHWSYDSSGLRYNYTSPYYSGNGYGRSLKRFQVEFLNECIVHRKEELGRRGLENAKCLRRRAYRGDTHIHSNYSDGRGTVAEVKQYGDLAQLDFIFVTDHRTIHQRQECKQFRRCWWGQEPGGFAHIGILGLDETFVPTEDSAADYRRAVEAGAFAFNRSSLWMVSYDKILCRKA